MSFLLDVSLLFDLDFFLIIIFVLIHLIDISWGLSSFLKLILDIFPFTFESSLLVIIAFDLEL